MSPFINKCRRSVLSSTGVGVAQNDAYALVALSPNLPRGRRGEESPTPDIRAIGVRTFLVPAGFCSADPSYVMVFAVNTWERQTHANFPGIFWFDLDRYLTFMALKDNRTLLTGFVEQRMVLAVLTYLAASKTLEHR